MLGRGQNEDSGSQGASYLRHEKQHSYDSDLSRGSREQKQDRASEQ